MKKELLVRQVQIFSFTYMANMLILFMLPTQYIVI